MKLSDAYKQVNGNTEKLTDLFYDGKIDTVVEEIGLFIKFVGRKTKLQIPPLLAGYQGYYDYSSTRRDDIYLM